MHHVQDNTRRECQLTDLDFADDITSSINKTDWLRITDVNIFPMMLAGNRIEDEIRSFGRLIAIQ